jgi:putative DNA primase/helicase
MIQNTTLPVAAQHLTEWTVKSGVSEEIAALNIESLSADELNARVKPKYPIQTPGWWCRGVNWRNGQPMGMFYGQARPDEKHLIDPDKGKTAKYMTASGMEPDAIFLAMPDKHYWAKVYADESIVRVWTEGVKKAAAGLTLMLATIALTGVWNWGKDGKLAPEVERWAQPGTKHIIAFDSDYRDKPSCRQAIVKFAKLLAAKGCEVLIATWTQEDKGMDDFIVKHGGDAFHEALANAETVKQWEKQFKKSADDNTEKNPPADRIAREIAEEYRDKLAYNNETGCWMLYEADYKGVWTPQTVEYVESIIEIILESRNIVGFNSYAYITNVVKIMRCRLLVYKWDERDPKEMLPFINGVLDVATGQLHPHSPGYRFTWHLPREHKPQAGDWSTINNFLDHLAGGNEAIKNLLICYCNAVIKGRHDLQKFLHLIGLGGTGKGTFARLLVSLIGKQNVHSTTLEDWLGNRFEGANAYKKRLVLFPDEDKQTGKLGKFLSLVGEDDIRAEEKGKKAFLYRYDGMVLVLSNEPIFAGGSANRVKRRVITVPCNNSVAVVQLDLETQFEPELSAFTSYVLSIPDEQVTNTLLGRTIPECTLEFWENRIRVDSIASWLNNCVIYDPTHETSIGANRHEGANGEQVVTLFGSYNRYCQNTGNSPKAHNNFSPDLLELCKSVLGWGVERKVTKIGKFVKGLRLRIAGIDDQIPTHDYTLSQKLSLGDELGDGLGDGLKPLPDKTIDGGDDQIHTQIEDKQQKSFAEDHIVAERADLEPSPSSPALLQEVFEQSPSSSPSSSPVRGELIIGVGRKADYCGEVVTIVGWENRGTKVQIEFSNRRMQYVKRGSLKAPKVN